MVTEVSCRPSVQDASEQQKSEAREGKIVFLGNGTEIGWPGKAPFYLLSCPECGELDCDFIHGVRRRYVSCHRCGRNIYF